VRFKLDENLPTELTGDLARLGHEAETVFDEGLAGAEDPVILAAASREDRIPLTLQETAHNATRRVRVSSPQGGRRRVLCALDKGIASVRDYPPQTFSGIVLFRPERFGRGMVLRFIRERLADVLALDLAGRLAVVGPSRIRIR
jgi:Domain of unknown function (DUF5615)